MFRAAKKSGEIGVAAEKYLKYTKGLGYAAAGAGITVASIQLFNNPTAGNSTRLGVQGLAAGAAFIPGFGWGVSLGIGAADLIWGDKFYQWIDNQKK